MDLCKWLVYRFTIKKVLDNKRKNDIVNNSYSENLSPDKIYLFCPVKCIQI